MRNTLLWTMALLVVLTDRLRATTRAALASIRIPAPAWVGRFDWSLAAHRGTHRVPRPSAFEGGDADPLRDAPEWEGATDEWHPADEIRAAAPSQPEETLMERRDREAAEIQRQRQLAEQAEAERTAEIHASLPERAKTDAALAQLTKTCEWAMDVIVNQWGISAADIKAHAREIRRKTLDTNTAELYTLQVLGDMVRPHLASAAVAATA